MKTRILLATCFVMLCFVVCVSRTNAQARCPNELLFVVDGLYFYSTITCPNTADGHIQVFTQEVETGCKGTVCRTPYGPKLEFEIVQNMLTKPKEKKEQLDSIEALSFAVGASGYTSISDRLPIHGNATRFEHPADPANTTFTNEATVHLNIFGSDYWFICFQVEYDDVDDNRVIKRIALQCNEPRAGTPIHVGAISDDGASIIDTDNGDFSYNEIISKLSPEFVSD